MKRIGVLVGAIVVATLVGMPAQTTAQSARTACRGNLPASGADPAALVAADNAFGFRLLHAVADADNTVLSPVSASLALDMALGGARGTTAKAMRRALSLPPMDRTVLAAKDDALLSRLATAGGLTLANSVWARAGIPLQPSYRTWVRHLGSLHTMHIATGAAAMNRWSACATHGTIPTPLRTIPRSTLVYLLNAVYFHGIWAHTFNPTLTRPHRFVTAAGGTIQVPMMAQDGFLPYTHGPGYQAIRLPYTGGRVSMTIVLPHTASFLHGLTAARFARIAAAMRPQAGALQMPRFSLHADRSLAAPLGALGMRVAFGSSADFSGMCRQRCDLTDVRQGTYLAVNEHGTVASALTSVGVGAVAIPATTFRMTVDRPFLLAIQDSGTGAILFLGSIGRP